MNARKRTWMAWGMIGSLLLVLIGLQLAGGSQAAPVVRSESGTATCQVNASGYCTLNHSLGVVPDAAFFQPALIGQLATSDPLRRTATTVQVRFFWHTGALFAAGTTIRYNYLLTTGQAAPSSPPVTTPPVTTPPVSTPPTSPPSTPPPTTPTEPGPSPVRACEAPNGDVIQEGAGRSYFEPASLGGGEYFVHNNNWNDGYGGTHVIRACSYDNWNVTVSIPAHSDRAVEAYPNVHRDYNDVPIDSIQSARFAAKAPACSASMIYNVAFDIWIGNDFDNELMIWTQNCNQVPAGTRLADRVIGGQNYQVWKSGGSTSPGGIFTYVATTTQLFGTMPLAAFFDDLQARNWISGPQTTWQVDYGVETVTTGGTSQRFDFTDFFIND